MIGELHGTAEAPHAVGEIACAAAERGPVVVALELEDTLQPTLDAFMAAPTLTRRAQRWTDRPC